MKIRNVGKNADLDTGWFLSDINLIGERSLVDN